MPIERIPITDDYDWLGARRLYVNASEAPVTCSVESYGSMAQLFAEKKGLRPPQIDSGVLRRGRWAEAAAAQAMADIYPEWRVRRARVHCIDRERRIAATPDGFAEAPSRQGIGLVEIKAVARSIFRQKWLDSYDDSLEGSATVPANFRIQVAMTKLLNPQCEWAVVVALIVGEYDWHLRLFDVEPDSVLDDRILYCANEFLTNYLDKNIMPPFDPQRDEELVKRLFPKDDGTEIDLTTDNRAQIAVEEYVETSAAVSRMKDRQSDLRTELTAKIGAHTFARLADGTRLSWKLQHKKAYAVEASDYRVFRVLKAKTDA